MKKDPNRFCTRFSDEDPIHFRAMDILEKKGRKKADFIAKGVVMHDAILEIVASGQQLSPDVHFVLLQLLQSTSSRCNLPPQPSPAYESAQPFNVAHEEQKGCTETPAKDIVQQSAFNAIAQNNNATPTLAHSFEATVVITDEDNHLDADEQAAILGAWESFGDD